MWHRDQVHSMSSGRILCTFPGRYGDLLWALPTIREIAEHTSTQVELLIAGEFAGIAALLAAQSYIASVIVDHDWSLSSGWEPPVQAYHLYDQVYHLGYRRWPELPLPFEIYERVASGWTPAPDQILARPWITSPEEGYPIDIAFGFTDCWFELKYALLALSFKWQRTYRGVFPPGSRWITEAGYGPTSWLEAAKIISRAKLLLTDCSALHVLGVGLGIPVLLVEPMDARWNPIFYPLGMDGPQVTVVKGLDGKPTFDARHLKEAIEHAFEAREKG